MGAIFLGNGEQSKTAVQHLHARLDHALAVLERHQLSTRRDQESERVDAPTPSVLRDVAQEIVRALGQDDLLIDELAEMTKVPSRYNPAHENDVAVEMVHRPREGWALVRDDAAGGGAYRRGPQALKPSEALRGFREMVAQGKWSAPR